MWCADIVLHWDLVCVDMAARYSIDMYDPEVLARPWPAVRGLIFGLLQGESQLAAALRREK